MFSRIAGVDNGMVQEWWRILDFLSFHPESAHALTWLLDDVGVPKDYRHMDGFGVHTYVFVKVRPTTSISDLQAE